MNDFNNQGYEAPVQPMDPVQPVDPNAQPGAFQFQQDPVQQDANAGNNKLMAVLSYFFLLLLVPLLTKAHESSAFVKHHLNQGIAVAGLYVGTIIVTTLLNLIRVTRYTYISAWLPPIPHSVTPWWVSIITSLLFLAVSVLAIIGIINAVQGKMSKLPLIGNLFTFFK